MLNLSTTLDTISATASSMDRLIRLDAVLAGVEPASSRSIEGLKLGRLNSVLWERLDPQVETIVENAIDKLVKKGAIIKAVDAPELAEAIEQIAMPLVVAEAKRWWSEFLLRKCGLTLDTFTNKIASPDVAEVFTAVAADETSDEQLKDMRHSGCTKVKDMLAQAMDSLDMLVYPTVPIAAPALHTTEVNIGGTSHPLSSRF